MHAYNQRPWLRYRQKAISLRWIVFSRTAELTRRLGCLILPVGHIEVCTCCGGVRAFGVPARERSDHHIRSDFESSGRDEWHHYSRERRNYPRERRQIACMYSNFLTPLDFVSVMFRICFSSYLLLSIYCVNLGITPRTGRTIVCLQNN